MLFNELYEQVFNEARFRRIGIFPGSFKPVHIGHYEMVKRAAEANDEIYIFISPKPRDQITAEEAQKVWELYLQGQHNVQVEISYGDDQTQPSPVAYTYKLIEEINLQDDAPNTVITVYAGTEEDFKARYDSLFSKKEQYAGNIGKIIAGDASNPIPAPRELAKYGSTKLSGRAMREALLQGDKVAFFAGLPEHVDKNIVWEIIN